MELYREIKLNQIDRNLFSSFIRFQEVDRCLRFEDGKWIVKSEPFIDDWTENDYLKLIEVLKTIVIEGGFLYGYFIDESLKGFVSVSSGIFGGSNRYMDLENLHISYDFRRKGIGRALFYKAAMYARQKGALKLYISAHSAIETQKFYLGLGCVDATMPCKKHVQAEPFDRQMEYLL